MLERMLEGALIVVALRAGAEFCGFGEPSPRPRRRPVVAAVFGVVLIAGFVVGLAVPGAVAALADTPGVVGWWRPFTAPFVQDSGVVGGAFNVVSATIVIALLEWTWGRALAAGAWLAGAWGLCAALGRVVGYHVSAGDVAAYRAGSSGATYFAAATLSAALVIHGTGRRRLLGLAGPAIAAALWVTANDGHGVVFVEGFAVGLVLSVASGEVGELRRRAAEGPVAPTGDAEQQRPGDRHHREPCTPERIGGSRRDSAPRSIAAAYTRSTASRSSTPTLTTTRPSSGRRPPHQREYAVLSRSRSTGVPPSPTLWWCTAHSAQSGVTGSKASPNPARNAAAPATSSSTRLT